MKEKKPIGCALLLVILGALGVPMLYLTLTRNDDPPSLSLVIGSLLVLFFVIGIILLVSVSEENDRIDKYNRSLQVTIIMNSGYRFPLLCDPGEAPQLFNQLEDMISFVGTDAPTSRDGQCQEENLQIRLGEEQRKVAAGNVKKDSCTWIDRFIRWGARNSK